MIQRLYVANFKVLQEIDIPLKPLTVIVGPNASGKTSVLQALQFISNHLNPDLGRIVTPGDIAFLRSRKTPDTPILIGCHVMLRGEESYLELNLSIGDIVRQQGEWPKWDFSFLNLSTDKLAAPSYPKSTSLRLPSDGSGLPSILAGLRLEEPNKFLNIVEQLKTIVINLIDVRVRQTQLEADRIGHELIFDLKGAESVPARAVSEGTLLALGVLTALATSGSPYLALIDDIERGLHPKALASYIQQLRALQKQNPELQIVATSHSPYLLDFLQAEEVLLTSLDEHGYTVIKSLTDHPEYERWKQLMDPGEFWSTVGEDWVAQDQKATA